MRALDDPFTAEMERLGPPILDYSVYRDDDRAGSQAQPAISAAQPIQRLAPISLGDFLQMEFPPREMVLGPWLPVGGLVPIPELMNRIAAHGRKIHDPGD